MKYTKSKSGKFFSCVNYILLIFLAITTLYPFIYTISISLSTTTEALRRGLHLYPSEISLLSYKMVFANKELFVVYGNTIYRTVFGTLLTLLVTSMFAYPLSRKSMPNREFFFYVLLFTMLFSGGLIPTYLLIKNLGLMNNRLVYILPGLLGAFNVIILKNFFQSLPDSLVESAKIDGANEFVILFKLVLPLSKPALATIALWVAVGHWNSWFDGMIYITDNSKQILQIFLQRIVQNSNSDLMRQGVINPDMMEFTPETIKAATIIVAILPILLVYPFLQKYFTKGVMLGSLKG